MAFLRYVREAFNARPWGMWIPPNWIALGAFALLGLLDWPFWIIGAGVEMGYLLFLSSSARFQRLVDSKDAFAQKKDSQKQISSLLARLSTEDQNRYRKLELRCQNVIQQQPEISTGDLQTQADGLGKLLYVYLRLLVTRSGILRVLDGGDGAASTKSIDMRVSEVKSQLDAATSPDLQKSLTDQLDILAERKKRRSEAHDKLQFIEAELTRIVEQVELIREGLVVTSDPGALSRKIDTVGQTLGSTTQWIKQQQELFGQTEDLLGDPPPVALEVPGAAQQH